MLPPKCGEVHAASSLGEQLRALGYTVFVKGWPVVGGDVALATLNVSLYTCRHPWGVVAGLGIWADKFASAFNLGAGALLGGFVVGWVRFRT
jgi:hypothetical protein